MYEKVLATAAWLKERMITQPQIALILGTGLGQVAEEIETSLVIPYKNIPHFPVSTVEGHDGQLLFGTLGGKNIMAMKGRFHYYEGYSMQKVTFPIRVMYELGIRTIIVSNAAGGANPAFRVGDIMIINDHINAFPEHPLRGTNIPTGPRFPDMHKAYDRQMIEIADSVAEEFGIRVVHGTYYGTQGPSFETPAEYRAFRTLGADAVGMSTVPEVIVARHCGMKVFGLSIISNMGITDTPEAATHEEVLDAGKNVEPKVAMLVTNLLRRI